MPDLVRNYGTNRLTSDQIGQAVDGMLQKVKDARRVFERRWYDNNFFDDGHHFRYVSRTDNRVVDLSERASLWNPMRAIPKASRQIRGIANLLVSAEPTPTVYPEKVSLSQYPSSRQPNPQTGRLEEVTNPQYQEALKEAKRVAKLAGHFLEEEFKKQDLMEKLALMVILAAKNHVAYLQVWPDAVQETIRTQVYDAFDIYLIGSLTEVSDSPFVIKTQPRLIAEIKADERFDSEKLIQVNPDNRHASSDIKEAYMKARHGGVGNPEEAATLIEKEAFIKEYLNDENMSRIRAQKNG